MRDVKAAIHSYLESKKVRLERKERLSNSVGRYVVSAASIYSDGPPSSHSGSMWASSGSSFRTGSLFRNGSSFQSGASFITCRDTPESAGSDNATLTGSGNSETGSSLQTSSSSHNLVPSTNLESIEIPLSLLGPDIMAAEQMWAELAPTLPIASPAPYSTFKQRYLSIYPYLWLHGRLWHGDWALYGSFLVTRYSTQSGTIEFSRIRVNHPDPELARREIPLQIRGPISMSKLSEYLALEPIITVGNAIFGLRIIGDWTDGSGRDPSRADLFHRVFPMPVVPEPSSRKLEIWPPMTFEAKDRTTRIATSQQAPLRDHPRYSLDLFALMKIHSRLDLWTRSDIELFSALDPKMYTPDIEHPLRGIWYWRADAGYEFVLFHQRRRNHLEGLKLTGNDGVPRGFKTFEFEELPEGTHIGEFLGRSRFSGRFSHLSVS